MSKTNAYTLIATALLGMLLYVILQFSRDVQTRAISGPHTEPAPEFIRETGHPRIETRVDLLEILDARGIDGERAIERSSNWRRMRGFPDSRAVPGITDEAPMIHTFDSLDNDALESMSEQGDLAATQALASRIALVDPFAGMELYAKAASMGSAHALLQIGSLRETIGDMTLEILEADAAYLRKLEQLRRDAPNTLQRDAFAYATAAIRDGGIAIVDDDLLSWVQRMAADILPEHRAAACEQSERIFLEFGAARRARGLAPITTTPPEVFMALPKLDERLPCKTTPHPIIQLLDLSVCSIDPVENYLGKSADLYICQT